MGAVVSNREGSDSGDDETFRPGPEDVVLLEVDAAENAYDAQPTHRAACIGSRDENRYIQYVHDGNFDTCS